MNIMNLATIRKGKAGRCSSWDTSGRNGDSWTIAAGQSRVLADIRGPGVITHIWMTQMDNYRECLLKITWDDAPAPSVLCPLGDFFGLGHGIVNSYQSLLFTASTNYNHQGLKGGGRAELLCADAIPQAGGHRAHQREHGRSRRRPRLGHLRVV